jgi:hypothetical protein
MTGNIRARNILPPFRNNFFSENSTVHCVVCVCVIVVFVVDELRVNIKYIKLLNITQQCFLW